MSGAWSVLRLGHTPGNTQEGRRHADSMAALLQCRRYMFAVGPPRSEITPVKPGTWSRMVSISRMTESSERLWMILPSCSVIEQKVHPLFFNDTATTENR